jgi:adenylylsulfate kinase
VSMTVWLTGLPSSGKTTIAACFAERMKGSAPTEVLDGDVVRRNFFPELGFSKEDRIENVRRIGSMAALLARHGVLVIVPVIAPYQEARAEVRRRHEQAGLDFVEVFVDADLDTCMRRDVKGLYRRAKSGEISGLTGYDDPYEPPDQPALHLKSAGTSIDSCVDGLAALVRSRLERTK